MQTLYKNMARYHFTASFGDNYWECVVIARTRREAVEIAFRELRIPSGADFTIEVMPG